MFFEKDYWKRSPFSNKSSKKFSVYRKKSFLWHTVVYVLAFIAIVFIVIIFLAMPFQDTKFSANGELFGKFLKRVEFGNET